MLVVAVMDLCVGQVIIANMNLLGVVVYLELLGSCPLPHSYTWEVSLETRTLESSRVSKSNPDNCYCRSPAS